MVDADQGLAARPRGAWPQRRRPRASRSAGRLPTAISRSSSVTPASRAVHDGRVRSRCAARVGDDPPYSSCRSCCDATVFEGRRRRAPRRQRSVATGLDPQDDHDRPAIRRPSWRARRAIEQPAVESLPVMRGARDLVALRVEDLDRAPCSSGALGGTRRRGGFAHARRGSSGVALWRSIRASSRADARGTRSSGGFLRRERGVARLPGRLPLARVA